MPYTTTAKPQGSAPDTARRKADRPYHAGDLRSQDTAPVEELMFPWEKQIEGDMQVSEKSLWEKTKEAASEAVEKAKVVGDEAWDKTKELADKVGDEASEAGAVSYTHLTLPTTSP